jgi:hypothetical protein
MPISRRIQSTALALALLTAFAAAVLGAPAAFAATKSTTASAPVDAAAGGPIDLQIWPGQGGKTAIITVVEIDAKTKLPAVVRIPVMPGSNVEWAGEVLGGPAASDIERPFKLVQGQGGQFAEFTLTTSHRGQIDAIGFPLKVSSDAVSVSVEYVQSVSSPLTAISVRIPAKTSKVKISPKPQGDPVDNADGESLYSIKPRAFKPGEKETISLSYSTIPPAEKAPGSDLNIVLIGLGVALALAVVAMIVIVRRNRPVASDADESDDESEDDDSDDEIDDDRPFDDDEDEPDLDFK